MADPVYLDYAATSPLDPRVRERMLAAMGNEHGYANPSSDHAPGRQALGEVRRIDLEGAARAALWAFPQKPGGFLWGHNMFLASHSQSPFASSVQATIA